MALYFLTYDLRTARNYQPLYDALKECNGVRILESTWCLNLINTNAKDLRGHFIRHIDSDDALIVAEARDWASYNTEATPK